MQIDIVTLFPEMYVGFLQTSIIKKAIEREIVSVKVHDLRDYGIGDYKQVDDRPFGGGAGMVLMIEPFEKLLKEIQTPESVVVALSAKGETYKQSTANDLAAKSHIILLAGHYEGFDQRILDKLCHKVISIGNYVLTGGELPSMIVADSVIRLLPEVLGNESSAPTDSYYKDDQTKQHPQYTRPAEYNLNGEILKVPDVLLSGNHGEVDKWREENSI